ncbi:MAG TPA: dTDP-4-dehydrorhamnose reductase [candidate division Zixibacteria bacterium]|nr:dTDP-4-dehydrorhamnose reductase [candidate division Zixibacteria bacterium]
MRVVVIGAKGQLGSDLVKVLSGQVVGALKQSDLDIRDAARVREVLSRLKPDAVVNTAAFNRVDDCEDDPATAFSVNAYGPRNLARVCAEVNCVLMHISTDYVFGGEKRSPYTEDDSPNPLSVYGTSKLAGEYFVRNACPRHFVVRTSGLYGVAGSRGKGGNFVETMIRLAREGKPVRVVDDQVLTPTYTKDLAEKLEQLLRTDRYGLYHITNSGQCSWYEFAAKIFALTNLRPDFASTTSEAFGSKARRPAYSVLESERLRRAGFRPLNSWEEALGNYLAERTAVLNPAPGSSPR